MEIAKGIHLIKCPWSTYFVSSCLIVDESLTVIDAGTGASPEISIYPYIRELGRKPSEISHILLTHAHLDHCAGVATMKRETGCMVGVHELGRPYLEEPGLIFKQLRNRFPTLDDVTKEDFEPVKADIYFKHGDIININERELKIIHVPGHSPDSSCLVDEEQGVYICGDSIQGRGGRRPLIFHGSTAYRESMKKLLEEPFNVLVNGHPFPPFEKPLQSFHRPDRTPHDRRLKARPHG